MHMVCHVMYRYRDRSWALCTFHLICIFLGCFTGLIAQQGDVSGENQPELPDHIQIPDAPIRSASDEKQTLFTADPRLTLRLLAAEPLVEDPVAVDFDSRGRLWVVEMRGYMLDLKGSGEGLPSGRVRILEDYNRDGIMDGAKVFLDGLIMPRALRILPDGILVAHGKELKFYTDDDGDDLPDAVELVDAQYVTGGNPEHQPNGLLVGLDNWIYSAKSAWRYRRIRGEWIKERTEFRGQWGIAQDDFGRLFYNVNYSQLHADLIYPNTYTRNPWLSSTNGINVQITQDQRIFTLRPNPGVNRAYRPGVLDSKGFIREFTSASAPLIYRGDYLPADYLGNAFVCEPAANLIKRNLLEYGDLEIEARFAWSNAEFLVSTDERFRPVTIAQAPDGSIVVVDFYRGIIQHKQYMTSHLRKQIEQRDLHRGVHYGRIWKMIRKDREPEPVPPLNDRDMAMMGNWLGNSNSWKRESAQRELVANGSNQARSLLIELLSRSQNPLALIHALWGLEGVLAQGAETQDGIHFRIGYAPLSEEEQRILLKLVHHQHLEVVLAAIRVLEKIWEPTQWVACGFLDFLKGCLDSTGSRALRVQSAGSMGRLAGFPEFESVLLPLYVQSILRHPDDDLLRSSILSGCHTYEIKLFASLLDGLDDPGIDISSYRGTVRDLSQVCLRSRRIDQIQMILISMSQMSDDKSVTLAEAFWSGLADIRREFIRAPLEFASEPFGLKVTGLHDKLDRVLRWPGNGLDSERSHNTKTIFNAQEKERLVRGRELYNTACAACHGEEGQGLPNLAPPLLGSDWLELDPGIPARVLLHGLEGPIRVNDTLYRAPAILPNMPSVGSLEDAMLADVLSYILVEFGFRHQMVSAEMFTGLRSVYPEREQPWTPRELLDLNQ